jgi:hypothetical protein
MGGELLYRVGMAAVVVVGMTAAGVSPAAASQPHGGRSVGWDTFRHVDRLPYLDAGAQTREYSSFDRTGGDFNPLTGNDNGSGGCIGRGGAGCVIAADAGPGEIDSIWFTRDHGVVSAMGRIRVELDDRAVVDAPLQSVVNGALGAPFVFPLVANGDQSSGGVYIKVPMPYRRSMQISVQSKLQYYHVVYRHFPDAEGVHSFDPADPARDVIATMRAAGTRDPKPAAPNARDDRRTVDIPPGAVVPVAASAGSGSVRALRLRLPRDVDTTATRAGLRLRIAFDGRVLVDSPVGEFFGSGEGPAAVRALMFAADPAPGAWSSAWWPMPYSRDVAVWLVNATGAFLRGVDTDVATAPDAQWASALAAGRAGYFTARSHAGLTPLGQDWSFARESGHGKFVGVAETMRGVRTPTVFSPAAPAFLEGAERVYVDGAASPRLYGTGTEDFFEGGWYFQAHLDQYPGKSAPDHRPAGGVAFSDPFTGMPAARVAAPGCLDYCLDVYREMLSEAVEYHSGLRFGIEHGKRDMIPADYSSTAFLYTSPTATTAAGDDVDPADPASRTAHDYRDSGAIQYPLSSQYEGTADTDTISGTVRAVTEPVTFRMAVTPENDGALLDRLSDQNAGYQSVDVLVDGKAQGIWLQPRSNTAHRWLDDSYLLPASATAHKTSVTITLLPARGAPPWTAGHYRLDPLLGP